MSVRRRHAVIVLRAGTAALAISWGCGAVRPARAQNVPNAVQGFSQNRSEPIQIESATLEVREKKQEATFFGGVKLVQGDTTMRCKSLVVFYTQGNAAPARAPKQTATAMPGSQQIRRIEAKGDVIITQKEQTATGDLGTFDLKANTVVLSGNVTVTQGQNVLQGERLLVDLTTGVSRVEAGQDGQGRVKGLLFPGAMRDQKGDPAASAPKPGQAAKPAVTASSPKPPSQAKPVKPN